jgi:two-component system, OmpR family, sensor kinase
LFVTQKRSSIASRLTRDLSIWMGGLWLLMSIAVTLYVQREIEDACDESLTVSAERLLELAAHEVGELREHAGTSVGLPMIASAVADANHLELKKLTYQIVDMAGAVLLRSDGAPKQSIVPPQSFGFSVGQEWRVFSLKHATEPLTIHVADSLAHRAEERRDTLIWLLLPLLAVLPFIAWLIRRIARHSLAPVEGLVAEIAERGVTNMNPVGGRNMPSEMQQISETTNHLLVRLKDALDVERSLAANAAHELRTPLAAARLRLASALGQTLPPDARSAIDEAVVSLDRLSRRAEKLLQMSRAETSASLSRNEVDLGRLACDVAQEFWRDPEASRRLNVAISSDTPIITHGDVDTLALALRNLIENALRYAGNASVEVEVSTPATVTVRDRGPGVDAKMLQTMSVRHVRRASDQAGYGLGLSIVKTVIERHVGTMEIQSPPPGWASGVAVILRFPPADAGY